MNNKSILVFIIATLLALLCAFFIMKRTDNKTPFVENSVNIQEEIITPAEQEQKTEVKEEDDDAEEKNIVEEVKPVIKTSTEKTAVVIEKANEEPVVEKITIQEGSVVEEVEDHGIRRNADGTYEITREFKMKSPTKYSFVDFGFLEKVSK